MVVYIVNVTMGPNIDMMWSKMRGVTPTLFYFQFFLIQVK